MVMLVSALTFDRTPGQVDGRQSDSEGLNPPESTSIGGSLADVQSVLEVMLSAAHRMTYCS
jgi:hypothetical protein